MELWNLESLVEFDGNLSLEIGEFGDFGGNRSLENLENLEIMVEIGV